MLWLIWRQSRIQMIVTAGLLGVFGVLVSINVGQISDVAESLTGKPIGDTGAWNAASAEIHALKRPLFGWLLFLVLTPALFGVFWGAPLLSKEYEQGTQRLAWTQSVPRKRWIVTKIAVLSAVAGLVGLLSGLFLQFWADAGDGIDPVNTFSSVQLFAMTGVAPVAWWVFAFVVGTSSGAFLRRMLPAVAVTIGVVVSVLVLIGMFGRMNYAEPERVGTEEAMPAGSWPAGGALVGADGREIERTSVAGGVDTPCPGVDGTDQVLTCVENLGYRSVTYFHPPERYWRFQWTEFAILMIPAAGLAWLTIRRVAKRPA